MSTMMREGEAGMLARGQRRERGAASMTLLVVVAVLLLAFAMMVSVRLATAADEASELQGAADAAALAGAQSIIQDAPGEIVSALVSGNSIPWDLGQARAQSFADRNDATLRRYEYDPLADRVRVTVRSRERLESGEREERSAVAKLGISVNSCDRPDEPALPELPEEEPKPEDPPDPGDESPADPPPPVEDESGTLECSGLDIPFLWEWIEEDEAWNLKFPPVNAADLIEDLGLEPALVE